MKNNILETILGAIVLAIATFFVVFAYNSSATPKAGYTVTASFDGIDGLVSGNDVRIGGVKIGHITNMDIDTKTYQAKISMNIAPHIPLPKDTSAAVVSESLLGGKYISLTPGGDEEKLKDGESIEYTQSSLNFEQLLGKFLFSKGDDTKK